MHPGSMPSYVRSYYPVTIADGNASVFETVTTGHLLRGGTPTSFDRLFSLRFGAAGVRALDEGKSGIMIALDPPTVNYVPLDQSISRMKTVPVNCDTILTARDLGVAFGD